MTEKYQIITGSIKLDVTPVVVKEVKINSKGLLLLSLVGEIPYDNMEEGSKSCQQGTAIKVGKEIQPEHARSHSKQMYEFGKFHLQFTNQLISLIISSM